MTPECKTSWVETSFVDGSCQEHFCPKCWRDRTSGPGSGFFSCHRVALQDCQGRVEEVDQTMFRRDDVKEVRKHAVGSMLCFTSGDFAIVTESPYEIASRLMGG